MQPQPSGSSLQAPLCLRRVRGSYIRELSMMLRLLAGSCSTSNTACVLQNADRWSLHRKCCGRRRERQGQTCRATDRLRRTAVQL